MNQFCYVPSIVGVSVMIVTVVMPITWSMCLWSVNIKNDIILVGSWFVIELGSILAVSHMIAHLYCYSSSDLEPIKNQNSQCPEGSLPKYSYYENGNIQSIECIGQKLSEESSFVA